MREFTALLERLHCLMECSSDRVGCTLGCGRTISPRAMSARLQGLGTWVEVEAEEGTTGTYYMSMTRASEDQHYFDSVKG